MGGRCADRAARHGARVLLVGAIMALGALLGAGCGESDGGTEQATRAVKVERVARDRWSYARARFNEMCAGCHTLADARADGRRFDLDSNLALEEEFVRGMILGGGPGMPPFASILSYREYEQLTAYLLEVAGNGDDVATSEWQRQLREEGERDRPPEWPPREYQTVPRNNP